MNKLTLTAEPGVPFITTERTFDAPREKVFAAFVEKDKLERWWTGPGYEVRVDTLEPVNGGRWRFINSDPKTGEEFAFHGNFHEVVPNERIIWTFEFEPFPGGHVSLERMEFSDAGEGKTTVRGTSTFLSVADRDGMAASDMEDGLGQSYANLDSVLQDA